MASNTCSGIMHLSMVCPRIGEGWGEWTSPQEFGHVSFQEDNFPSLGPKLSVRFPSLLEAFLNDFLIIFQNSGQKEDRY